MKTKLLGLLTWLVVGAAGCNLAATEDDFRVGVPAKAGLALKMPNSGNALLGDVATWYTVTLNATNAVNGGVLGVLDLLHNVVSQQPTSHTGNTYIWGPGAANPLEPNVWRLTVTQNGPSYAYNLDGKKKGDPDTSFVTILSGTHTPVQANGKNDPEHGNGTFLLDWDKRATLNNPDGNVGTADVTYDHRTADVTVDVDFTNVKDDGNPGQTHDAVYHYKQPKGGDGLFQFSTRSDVSHNGSAAESIAIESRWKQDGSGRSDLEISQGDLGTHTATANECWDTNFKESYYHDANTVNSDHFGPDQGQEPACSFAPAEYFDGK